MIRRDADSLRAFVAHWEVKLADGQWDGWSNMVRNFAWKVEDPVVADWLRRVASREHIGSVLSHIGALVTVGDFDQAERRADGFEREVQHIERLVHRRWTESGHRMLERDDPGGRPPKTERDLELAREYQRRSEGPMRMSETNLKAEVGKAVGLKRSAAIDAVNRGLKILQEQ